VDILRLHLAVGVIESLTGLSSQAKAAYIADINAVADAAIHGNTEVHVQGQVKISHTNWRMVDERIPIAVAAEAARRVGAYLVTAKLKALANHSIQDIETWDDSDETAALDVAARIAANQSIVGAGDDAQLLAGCNIATMARPDLYEQMTDLLHLGLDESFVRDPIWGSVKPNVMIVPAVLYDIQKEPAPAPLRTRAGKIARKAPAKAVRKAPAKVARKAPAKLVRKAAPSRGKKPRK
jgi:hypothetical protein